MSWEGGSGFGDGVEEGWRKNADTHKMSTEEVKKAGVEGSKRPPGHHPGGVLHQRRSLPMSYPVMAMAGVAIAFAAGYTAIYAYKKPDASAVDVAKVATGTARPEDTHPKK